MRDKIDFDEELSSKGSDMEEDAEYAESEGSLDEEELGKIKSALAILKPLAEKEGCTVSELVEKHADAGESEGEEEEADSGKVGAIVARLKAKQGMEA